MNMLDMPFNKFIGIKRAENTEYIFMMDNSDEYSNHLGSVHASATFALAEATSGEFLINTFREYIERIISTLRRVEMKYRKPTNEKIYSKAEMSEEDLEKTKKDLAEKGRALTRIKVSIYDESGFIIMQSIYEWYLQRN